MHLISLEVENFRQHKHTSIEFLPGVTGIIGRNGSGKTTLLEAIAWALYGAKAIRGDNDTVRCRAAEANSPVEVKLTFSLGPHVYTITRRMEPAGRSSASLSIDGLPSRTGFKEVTEAVTKLLGMDYQAFFTSFFTAQKELEFMRGVNGRERAKAISRMLGYERLTKARDNANKDRLGLQREIEGLEHGLGDPFDIKNRKTEADANLKAARASASEAEAAAKSAEADFSLIRPKRDLSEQKSKRHTELARRIELDRAEERRATGRAKELRSELSELAVKEKELAELAPKLAEYNKAGEEFRRLADLQKHETQRAEIDFKLKAALADVQSLEQRLSELTGAEEAVEAAEKSAAELGCQIAEVDGQITREREAWSAARYRVESELGRTTVERDKVAEKRLAIEEAGQDGKCPTCERPLGEELPKVLDDFDSQLVELDAKKSKLQSSLDALLKEPDGLTALLTLRAALDCQRQEGVQKREEVLMRKNDLLRCRAELEKALNLPDELKRQLADIPTGFDQARYDELRAFLEQKKATVYLRSGELRSSLSRQSGLEADLKREQDCLDRAVEEIQLSLRAASELKFSHEEHDKLAVRFELASQTLTSAKVALERARGDVKTAEAGLGAAKDAEQAYKCKESDLKDKRRSRLYLQTLAESFDRLRAELTQRTAPELAAAAGELLSEMTDGRYNALEIDDDYEATVRDDGELKKVLSGGEEDVLNLSLRLAVSRMISDRAGQDLTLLVLDEVFGSLDDIRRGNLVSLLQTLKTRFEQIILITHVESIHDTLDNCIWVDYDEQRGTSRVRAQLDNGNLVSADLPSEQLLLP